MIVSSRSDDDQDSSPQQDNRNHNRKDSKTQEPSKDKFLGEDNLAFTSDSLEKVKCGNNETQITIHGADSEYVVNETSNPELISLNILNVIPEKPKAEYGPYKKYDDYFIPVNHHKKFHGRSEKLYVTKDKRKKIYWKKFLCWIIGAFVLASIVSVAVLAGLGLISQKSPNSISESVFGTKNMITKLDPTTTMVTSTPSSLTQTIHPISTKDQGILPLSTTPSYSNSKSTSNFYESNLTEVFHESTPGFTALLNTPKTPDIYVPSAIDLEVTLEHLDYETDFSDRTTQRFNEISLELNTEMRKTLSQELHLKTVTSKIKKIMPEIEGSRVVMRIGWIDNEINSSNVTQFLQILENIGRYSVLQGIISIYAVVNMCNLENGGCSHFCSFDHKILDIHCTCPENMIISTNDEKICNEATNNTTDAFSDEWTTPGYSTQFQDDETTLSQEPISLAPVNILVSSSTLSTDNFERETNSTLEDHTDHHLLPFNETDLPLEIRNETLSDSQTNNLQNENKDDQSQMITTEQMSNPEIELENNRTSTEPVDEIPIYSMTTTPMAILHTETSEIFHGHENNENNITNPIERTSKTFSNAESLSNEYSTYGPSPINMSTTSSDFILPSSYSSPSPKTIVPTSNVVTPLPITEEETVKYIPVEIELMNNSQTAPEEGKNFTQDDDISENLNISTLVPTSSTTQYILPFSSKIPFKSPEHETIGDKVIVSSYGVNRPSADSNDETVVLDDGEELHPPIFTTQSLSLESGSDTSDSSPNSSGSHQSEESVETKIRPFSFSDRSNARTTESDREEMTTVHVSLANDTNVNNDEDVTENTLLSESINHTVKEEAPLDIHANIRVTGHPIYSPIPDKRVGETYLNSSSTFTAPIVSTTQGNLNENNSSSEGRSNDSNASNISVDSDDENELN